MEVLAGCGTMEYYMSAPEVYAEMLLLLTSLY